MNVCGFPKDGEVGNKKDDSVSPGDESKKQDSTIHTNEATIDISRRLTPISSVILLEV
jgi:hypothetical protein